MTVALTSCLACARGDHNQCIDRLATYLTPKLKTAARCACWLNRHGQATR